MASRVSQLPVEVILLPTSQKARDSQLPVEVAMAPSANARLSQLPVETVYGPVPGALVSQLPVEVVGPVTAPALVNLVSQLPVEVVGKVVGNGLPTVTQVVAEPVTLTTSTARVTQVSPEAVLYPTDELARVTQTVLEVIHKTNALTIVIQNNCWIAVQTDFPFIAIPAN